MSLNDLEVRGLKEIMKEMFEEDYKETLEELQEDVRELQGNPTDSEEDEDMPDQEDEEEDEELPEEESLEDNPQREVHEEKIAQARQKPSGTRVTKEDMNKLQTAPPRRLPKQVPQGELDDEEWDEEQ